MVDNDTVISCSREPVIKVFDLQGDDDGFVGVFEGHEMAVTAIDYRAEHLVSGARDCTLRVWDYVR